jgi:rhamnosyltransferase
MRTISVIVRARDEAASIGRCLALVRGQRVEGHAVELIVVDNDSRDATAAIAAESGARVLGIGSSEFSFGRALNLGAAQATGELLVALSAHAFALDDGWLARLAQAMADPSVACASGEAFWPDGSPLRGPVAFDGTLMASWPEWGFSNAAGAFRASLWRERGFREDLPGCEDKEWCRYWVSHGYACLLDPALVVDHDHTHDPVASIFARARREAIGLGTFLPPGTRRGARSGSVGALAREWWTDTRFYGSPWRARLSHRRAARLLGAFAGARAGPLRPGARARTGRGRPGGGPG